MDRDHSGLPATARGEAAVLSTPYVLEYTYRRSVGPVIGRFFAGLREGKIQGALTTSGKVVVPPTEYDPETGEPIVDLVEVGGSGVVTTWCWVAEPRPRHPLDRPFGFALVKLDGADTALLHAVDAVREEHMKTKMRVKARFRAERTGAITDLVCFDPEISE